MFAGYTYTPSAQEPALMACQARSALWGSGSREGTLGPQVAHLFVQRCSATVWLGTACAVGSCTVPSWLAVVCGVPDGCLVKSPASRCTRHGPLFPCSTTAREVGDAPPELACRGCAQHCIALGAIEPWHRIVDRFECFEPDNARGW